MYVGSWFAWMFDGAVLALFALVLMIILFIKKGQYAKQAKTHLAAEIRLPSGYRKYHVIEIDDNAKSITIDDFDYFLHPKERRYIPYPLSPFLGFSWGQVPIRTEEWDKDNPEPIRANYKDVVATAREINVQKREFGATLLGVEAATDEARQKLLENNIRNQPNKTIVYAGLLMIIAAIAISAVFLSSRIAPLLQLVGLK